MRMLNPSSRGEFLEPQLSALIGISPEALGERITPREIKIGDYLLIDSPSSLVTGQLCRINRKSNGALTLAIAQPHSSPLMRPGSLYTEYYDSESQISKYEIKPKDQVAYYRRELRNTTREPNSLARIFGGKTKHYQRIPLITETLKLNLESPTLTLEDAGRQIVIPTKKDYCLKLTTISSIEEFSQKSKQITLSTGRRYIIPQDQAVTEENSWRSWRMIHLEPPQ